MAGNTTKAESLTNGQLKSLVDRIERMEEEKQACADDIKQIYAEAKGNGFDTKILRKIIRLRKQDADAREEEAAILDVYLIALGMGPLFDREAAE